MRDCVRRGLRRRTRCGASSTLFVREEGLQREASDRIATWATRYEIEV
jgi:hypothetical protein